MRGFTRGAFLVSALFLLSVFSVLAANTHLNVTIAEVVNQNITFAQSFYLEENQTYLLIEGTLTVRNPGTENVFDVDLKFVNVESMLTDFIYSSGRMGYQTVYAQNGSWAEYAAINDTYMPLNASSYNSSEPANVTQDLDDDGNIDYVKVNATHIIFNISSEYEPVAIRLRNGGSDVDISNAGTTPVTINMLENITSLAEGDDEIIVYGTINISGTTSTDNQIDESVVVNITDFERNYSVIHIPELRGGQESVFIYNISGSVNPPLDIDTNYTHAYNRKVLAGSRFTVNDSVSNVITLGVPVSNINITIKALNITWNQTPFNFSLLNLSDYGDYQNG